MFPKTDARMTQCQSHKLGHLFLTESLWMEFLQNVAVITRMVFTSTHLIAPLLKGRAILEWTNTHTRISPPTKIEARSNVHWTLIHRQLLLLPKSYGCNMLVGKSCQMPEKLQISIDNRANFFARQSHKIAREFNRRYLAGQIPMFVKSSTT